MHYTQNTRNDFQLGSVVSEISLEATSLCMARILTLKSEKLVPTLIIGGTMPEVGEAPHGAHGRWRG